MDSLTGSWDAERDVLPFVDFLIHELATSISPVLRSSRRSCSRAGPPGGRERVKGTPALSDGFRLAYRRRPSM